MFRAQLASARRLWNGANENTREVASNVALGFVIKGASMFVALFTMPAYITYFSDDVVLGVWFVLLSILAWVLNFDMGLGNGLRNRLVEPLASGDFEECRAFVSSAYACISGLGLALLLFGLAVLPLLPWQSILGTGEMDSDAFNSILLAIPIIYSSIVLQFVLRLVVSILYALQKAFVPGLLGLITNVMMLTGTLISIGLNTGRGIVQLAVMYFFAVNIPLAIATLVVFCGRHSYMRPRVSSFSSAHASQVVKLGVSFLMLQAIAMVMNNTQGVMVSYLFGAGQVVNFQLYYKVFMLMSSIALLAINPMWSAITKAKVEHRYSWLSKAFRAMFALPMVVLAGNVLLAVLIQPVFDVWLREETRTADISIALAFAAYGALYTWLNVCCYISNGLEELKLQFVGMGLGCILTVGASFALAPGVGNYLAVVYGSMIGIAPYAIAQTLWTWRYCRKLIACAIPRS